MLKKLFHPIVILAGLLGIAGNGFAQDDGPPVEYLRICSLYGAGFYYIPGADICKQTLTPESRQQTFGGTWRTFLPYSEGDWVTDPQAECGPGKLVKLGKFQSTDFKLDIPGNVATPAFNLTLDSSQFISKIMMSGGFYDPRVPFRAGVNGAIPKLVPADGLCVRPNDPGYLPPRQTSPPPYWSYLPIGCISNSRIANVPMVYSIHATSAYPQISSYFDDSNQQVRVGPDVIGKQLIVSTDVGPKPGLLSYCDATAGDCSAPVYDDVSQKWSAPGPGLKPLAGTVSVWACVERGQ
jgi:hypothetical protein